MFFEIGIQQLFDDADDGSVLVIVILPPVAQVAACYVFQVQGVKSVIQAYVFDTPDNSTRIPVL